MNILILFLGMSYNMLKMLSSEFQDFKINPINNFNPISPKGGGSENYKPITRNVYNMPQMLCSIFQSHSIKIEDICRDRVSDGVSEGKLDL